jgi:hypothetical protein
MTCNIKRVSSGQRPNAISFQPAKILALAILGILTLAAVSSANAGGPSNIEISNGISGAGQFTVNVRPAGDASSVNVYPIASATGGGNDVMQDFINFVRVGNAAPGIELISTGNGTVALVAQTGTVISNGSFAGSNGPVSWNSESRIAAGTQRYELTLNFTSSTPFGALRYISYFDADVIFASDDRMVVVDRATNPSLRMLVMDDDQPVGIAHSIPNDRLQNASYRGWVARPYSNLVTNIRSAAGEVFSPSGVIDLALISAANPLFPFSTSYTNDNHTHAFAVDLDPAATQAKVVVYIDAFPRVLPDLLLKTGFEEAGL